MSWIESHQSLEREDKVFKLRKAMCWDKNQAVGFLHRFWWLALEQTPHGDVSGLAVEFVSEMLDMRPEITAQALAAMEDAGFLYRTDAGNLLIRNWIKYTKRYLRDTLWKSDPEKYAAAEALYAASVLAPPKIGGKSAENPQIPAVPNQTLPTTYSPNPAATAPGPDNPPAEAKHHKAFTASAEAMQLTSQLCDLMRKNDPAAKIPEKLDKWTHAADCLLRIDKRAYSDAVAVLDWCQRDPFWRGNILSMPTFRAKFPQLKLQRERNMPAPAFKRRKDMTADRVAAKMAEAAAEPPFTRAELDEIRRAAGWSGRTQ